MNFHFQYLSTRSGKSILLFFDKSRYLFNCFEGFQRYSIEAGLKLKTLDAIFLCTIDSIPSFLGTYLTLGDTGKSFLKVLGPSIYEKICKKARAFAQRKDLLCCFTQEYSDGTIAASMIDVDGECSYVLKLPKIRGKFLVELVPKVLPKKLYAKLIGRETVEFGGNEYNGADFVGEDIQPKTIAIVYCSKNYIKIKEALESLSAEVFIVFNEDCAKYLKKHMQGVFYVLKKNNYVEFESFYNAQLKANQIDSNYLVPIPSFQEEATRLNRLQTTAYEVEENYIKIDSLDILKFNKKDNTYIINKASHNEYLNMPKPIEKEPFILFLGTGCAIPSKYRNVSSTIVKTNRFTYILDCGEDSLYQINRVFGSYDILKTLNFIFISHSHADHHLGLISVLKKCLELDNRIKVFGPRCLKAFIEMFLDTEDFCFYETEMACILREEFYRRKENFDMFEEYVLKFDFDYKIKICRVPHSLDSCGIMVKTDDLALAYSGDTKPDSFFEKLCAKCDVIIHEATFEDELSERAKATKHSTDKDAIKIWKASGAKKVILTHFSQRYKSSHSIDENITYASDFLRYLLPEKKIK